MWDPLVTAIVGGIVVSGFGIAAGAFLWVTQRRWEMSRDAYKELLPLMGELFAVHRSLGRTLEKRDPKYLELLTERMRLSTEFDRLVLFARVFLSQEAKEAITSLENKVGEISTPLLDLEDLHKKDPDAALKKAMDYYKDLTDVYERAVEATQRSAEIELASPFSPLLKKWFLP